MKDRLALMAEEIMAHRDAWERVKSICHDAVSTGTEAACESAAWQMLALAAHIYPSGSRFPGKCVSATAHVCEAEGCQEQYLQRFDRVDWVDQGVSGRYAPRADE